MANHNETLRKFSWEAPEFERRRRGPAWVIGSMVIAGALAAFSLWRGNFLFAVFILIAELLLLFLRDHEPKTRHFSLDDEGITINPHRFHPYREFESFSVLRGARGLDEIILEGAARLRFPLTLPIFSEDTPEAAGILKEHLAEEEAHERFFETLVRLLGF